MNNKVRILGLDPGSRIAGFACIASNSSTPVHPTHFAVEGAGALRFDRRLTHAQRVAQISQAIAELILEFKPQVCVLEKAFCGVNVSSALKLGETRGAAIAAIYQAGLELVEVSPTHVKKSITGSGRADKEQIAQALQRLMGFQLGKLPYDVSDALGVALTYGLSLPYRSRLPQMGLSASCGEKINR